MKSVPQARHNRTALAVGFRGERVLEKATGQPSEASRGEGYLPLAIFPRKRKVAAEASKQNGDSNPHAEDRDGDGDFLWLPFYSKGLDNFTVV